MLEYFTYKKVKKHRAEKKASQIGDQDQTPPPLLDDEDQAFLERVVSTEGTPPPLPERPHGLDDEARDAAVDTPQATTLGHQDPLSASEKGHIHTDNAKGKEASKAAEKKKSNRFSFLQRSGTKKVCLRVHRSIPLQTNRPYRTNPTSSLSRLSPVLRLTVKKTT